MNYIEIINRARRVGACSSALEWAETVTSEEQFWSEIEPDWKVWLALRSWCPVNILTKLAEDSDRYVRNSVAENPKTPVNILTKLAEDSDWYVRYGVAENPNNNQFNEGE